MEETIVAVLAVQDLYKFQRLKGGIKKKEKNKNMHLKFNSTKRAVFCLYLQNIGLRLLFAILHSS